MGKETFFVMSEPHLTWSAQYTSILKVLAVVSSYVVGGTIYEPCLSSRALDIVKPDVSVISHSVPIAQSDSRCIF